MKLAIVTQAAFVLISFLGCQDVQVPEVDGPQVIINSDELDNVLPAAADRDGPVVIVTSNIFFPRVVSGRSPVWIFEIPYGADVQMCFALAPGQDNRGATWKAGDQEGTFDGGEICVPPPHYIFDSYSLGFEVSDEEGTVTKWGIRVNQVPMEVESALDIQPNRCRNALNPQSRGLFRMALLGRPDFDVRQVYSESLWLSGPKGLDTETIEPVRTRFEDVGSPAPTPDPCNCSTGKPDGLEDLVLWFRVEDLAQPLPPSMHRFADGSVTLWLRGLIAYPDPFDSRLFMAGDCVQVGAPSP